MVHMFYLLCACLLLLPACGREYSVQPKTLARKKSDRKAISKETPAEKKQRRDAETWHGKHTKDMTYDELKQAKASALFNEEREKAMEYLARMLVLGKDLQELQEVRLELADLCFEMGELSEAEIGYRGFITLYPSSKHIEYVRYRTVLACYYQTLDADRDQTKTKEAIKVAQEFLNHADYQTYLADVKIIRTECTTQLFESEKLIFEYYLDRSLLTCAERRLDDIKKQFGEMSRFNPMIVAIEMQLAQAQGNTALYQEKQQLLAQLEAATPPAMTVASNTITPRTYSARF
jgi:outer membrane protein assembly factor BamD